MLQWSQQSHPSIGLMRCCNAFKATLNTCGNNCCIVLSLSMPDGLIGMEDSKISVDYSNMQGQFEIKVEEVLRALEEQ